MFDFYVRKSRLAHGAPVNEPCSFVYEPFIVQVHEMLFYRIVAAFVHGESEAAPVTAGTHLLLLQYDAAFVLFFPGPGSFQELLAAYFFL